MYVIKLNPVSCTTYENLYCIGISNFTKSYTYALCQDKTDAVCPGLRLFDMESIINRNKSGMVLLKNIDVGSLGQFEWSFNLIRIGIMKSFSHLVIIPILHRNMNKFMGIANLDDYIAYKVIKDKMMAITQNGLMCSWNITTAKFLTRTSLKNHDYSDYTNYKTYNDGSALLQSNEDVSDQQDTDYF